MDLALEVLHKHYGYSQMIQYIWVTALQWSLIPQTINYILYKFINKQLLALKIAYALEKKKSNWVSLLIRKKIANHSVIKVSTP